MEGSARSQRRPTTLGRVRTAVHDEGVEANARLTGATGLVLLVLLAVEGVTILSIHQLLTLHVAVGLALLPPVALKMGSTLWRFAHYYAGDPRYVAAGPPAILLRLVGPFVWLLTAVVLGSGVALIAAGRGNGPWLFVHKASFVLWFGVTAVHVLGHLLRAGRLASSDVTGPPVRGTGVRWSVLGLSLVAGLVVAVATWGIANGYGFGDFGRFGPH